MDPDVNAVETLVGFNIKHKTRQLHLHLLNLVNSDYELSGTGIVSSIWPRIGKLFQYADLEASKKMILQRARSDLLKLGITEAKRDEAKARWDLLIAEERFKEQLSENDETALDNTVGSRVNPQIRKLQKKMDKKVKFFSRGIDHRVYVEHVELMKIKRRRNRNAHQRRKNNAKYRRNHRRRRKEEMLAKVQKIKDNKLVINLSSMPELDPKIYLYLAKGLNFVEVAKGDKEDLLFDTQDFIRKLAWRMFFKSTGHDNQETDEEDLHAHMKPKGTSHPDFSHPILEQVKTKLLGWVSNLELSEPQKNLSIQELQGKKLLLDLIKKERVFITKADKGGATLVFDFQKVVDLISEEVSDQGKYIKIDKPVEKKMEEARKKIVSTVLAQEMVGNITGKDKTTITGLNEQNNMKHNPEYRAVPPKIWPLFKVHKLSQLQIEQKVTPPQRFINAAKHGPLYRLGQWSSPHLTKISRAYCGEEFILDTPHLLRQIEDFNREPSSGNLLLATLDVEALYPSINPQLALSAITEAFAEDSTTSDGIKTALREFIELGFEESFVTFRGSCYKPLIGIPTGGCDSRQIADIFLHWLLFTKIKDNIAQWSFVKLFRRFIDDGFLIWKGTKRQFSLFVTNLNALAENFGIRFGSWEIGKSVNFLDLTLYLDDQNKVQYKIYTKPTDARNYLRTDSFHPPHVFRSVAFSQMLRVVSRNS